MKAILSSWSQRLQALSARDRRALTFGSAVILAVTIVGGTLSLQDRSAAAAERTRQKAELLATLPAAVDRLRRIERLGDDRALPLGTLARRLLETAGLDAEVQAGSDGGIALQLTEVPFDATLELLAEFAAQRIALRTAHIEAGGKAGMVNARFELAPRSSRLP